MRIADIAAASTLTEKIYIGMEVTLKLISLFFSFGMLYVAYIVRRIAGSWLLPSCVYSVGWFLFTIIPLLLLPLVPINPLAVGYILLTCIVFSLPVLTVQKGVLLNSESVYVSTRFDSPFLRLSFYGFALLTFVSLSVSIIAQGISISSLSSDFFATSNALIADRYSQTTVDTVFTSLSNVSSYVTVSLAGLIFPGYASRWSRLRIVVVAMTPSLIVMTVLGAKGMIFLCIAMFYAGTLVRRLYRGDHRLIDSATVKKAFLAALVLLPFVTVSFLARGLYEGGTASTIADGLYRYAVSYSSAHLYAFADWFSWHVGMASDQLYVGEPPTGGFYTFMSVFQALGSNREVPPGVYEEYYQYSWYVQTNIYTIFRGLLTDFTLIGSLVFLMAAGFVSNYAFMAMTKSNSPSWTIAFYLIFCGLVYTSFIISLFIWNSMYPVFIILGLILHINNARSKAEAHRYSKAMQHVHVG